MALKVTVPSLDDVSEDFRGLYVEKNGMFHLDVEGMEDTAALRASIEKERKARREAEQRAKLALSDEDLEEIERLRMDAAKAKGADEIINRERARQAKVLEDKERREKFLLAEVERSKLKEEALALMGKHKANAELLMPHFERAVRVEEIDGKFQVVPVAAGSLDEIVTTMKSAFPQAFADSGHSGSGAVGGGGGGQTKGNLGGSKSERAAYFASKFPDIGKE